MAQLRITMLSALTIHLDGEESTQLAYNEARALLLLLAMAPHKAHTRASLCDQLWPDMAEQTARNNLSQALTYLGKALPAHRGIVLHTTTQTVQLSSEGAIEVDVVEPEALLDSYGRITNGSW